MKVLTDENSWKVLDGILKYFENNYSYFSEVLMLSFHSIDAIPPQQLMLSLHSTE